MMEGTKHHPLCQSHSEGPTCIEWHLKGVLCSSNLFCILHASILYLSSLGEAVGSYSSAMPPSLLDVLSSVVPSAFHFQLK